MGRPGCEQCCGKPEPAECLSCLHACQYALVNDPVLLERYWNERVYQPTGFEGDPADVFGGIIPGLQDGGTLKSRYAFGYNATRTYTTFDPETHPCNEDKFEYIVHVISCQAQQCIPNGDFDICVNGENLGTYIGYDPLNPQDIPKFQAIPLFPYTSKHNDPQVCGPAEYKSTIFGTSQEAIDHVVDTNFGFGWLQSGGIGQPSELIPPAERRTLADYNTSVVAKLPFLMDARDIIIDQSGNPTFGPKAGSFDVKLIPNPGINNLRLDVSADTEGSFDALDYATTCAVPRRTVDRDDLQGSYPVQWTPPSEIQIIIYSLERPVGNDNATGFRVCTVANACLCAGNGEEECRNIGLRPLCVNPFDSDNYENGQPEFISSADFNSSTECTCNNALQNNSPSPTSQNSAPTCYYEADINITGDQFRRPLSSPYIYIDTLNINGSASVAEFFSGGTVDAEGDWKAKTREIMQAFVDSAQDPDSDAVYGFLPRGSAVRIAEAMQDMLEDLLASTAGCPERLSGDGYAGPFDLSGLIGNRAQIESFLFSAQSSGPNLSEAYIPISLGFTYNARALSDALASDIINPNTNTLNFNGTCCASWRPDSGLLATENVLRSAGGNVRGKVAEYIPIGDTWSTNLGRLLNMNPGQTSFGAGAGFGSGGFGWNTNLCESALDVPNGDGIPLYLDLVSPLNASASYLNTSGGTSRSSLGRHDNVATSGYVTYLGFSRDRAESRRVFPFAGHLDGARVVYTFNDLSTAEYYFNVDAECVGIGCLKPELPDATDPCLPCSSFETVLDPDGNPVRRDSYVIDFLNDTLISQVCNCPPDLGDPCQPFAADPANCPDLTNGTAERLLDPDGNVYCRINCNTGYVLEYDDVTGCAQCVQVQCQGNCNFSWTGNSWNLSLFGTTCACKCEPPNIPGTFVGEIGQGTCVDDTANRICGEGKCWWTWFVLVGGGGEWRKNEPDDLFGTASTCECRCDPPNRDGFFPGEEIPTLCFE